jgi:cysteine-rich repeat protein
MGDPVIALFNDVALKKPASTTLENDSYVDAKVNPTPTAVASDNWLVYDADMSHLTPENQAQLSMAATNTNEEVIPATLLGAQDLGDVFNTRVNVTGGNTGAMAANYKALSCGGTDTSPDAIYQFYSSQGGAVRIQAGPTGGYDTVIELFDGTNGAPLRAVDQNVTTVDLNTAGGCGDHVVTWNEECDDGNNVSGDGCSSTCKHESGWTCDPSYRGAGDGLCDCGCGLPDPDCADNTPAACTFCDDTGSCAAASGCGSIDALDNSRCSPQCGNGVREPGEQCDDGNTTSSDGCSAACVWEPGVWHCDAARYNQGTPNSCDCGCGIPDPDCSSASAAVCNSCGLPGACGSGSCPSTIDPTDNAACTAFGTAGTNPNDAVTQAIDVDLSAGAREYLGNTASLHKDIAPSQLACGAGATSPDAIYSFRLRKTTRVEIDATASSNKPVLGLYNTAALGAIPTPVFLQNDEPAQANFNPSPTPVINNNWVRYSGDTVDLTVSAQPQTTINNQDNANNDTPTELIDPINRRITVSNANTGAASVQATYPAPTCGGADDAKDQLYRFVPSQSGDIRISTNYPQTALHPVLALYDGTNGKPLTRADLVTTTTAVGSSNVTQDTAITVPIEGGDTYVYTGTAAGMPTDIDPSVLSPMCSATASSAHAVYSFSLSRATDVEISAEGSSYDTVLNLFDGPFARPSVLQLTSAADSITQAYDTGHLPRQPEAGCSPYDWNGHRYWFCSTKRTWDGARAKCRAAGQDLVAIGDAQENSEIYGQIAPTGESHLIGLRQHTPYTSWGPTNGDWVDGSASSYRAFQSGEPNQPADSTVARMRSQDGQWVDAPESWQTYRYVCEDATPATLPAVPTASASQAVDVFGATRHFVGSTAGTPSSVGNLIGCGAAAAAPDAVFRFDVTYISDVRVDFHNSFAGSVIGLFKGGIGAQGYTDAGSRCALVTAPTPQLALTNLTPGTYYLVLTSTAAAGAGAYEVVFSATSTDADAFTLENDTLSDALAHPLGDISNKWIVKKADMAHLGTDLITPRTVDMPGPDTNDSHVSPAAVKDLGNTAGQQITVINASTAGLTSDYARSSCGLSDDGVDAIYKFTPATTGAVRIQVAPTGHEDVIALYNGAGGAFPLLKSEAPLPPVTIGNTNDKPIASGAGAAQAVTVGDPQTFFGNLGALASDVVTVDTAGRPWDRRDLLGGDVGNVCRAAPTGRDAFFTFTLPATTTVSIDSTGTNFAHTLALWSSTDKIIAPAATTYEKETAAAASPALPMDGQWYVFNGNTSNLRPGGDTRVTKTAGTDFQNNDAIQDLGTLAANTQIVTSGADSSAAGVTASYSNSTLTCGAADTAHDMAFKFKSSASGGTAVIAVNNPAASFPPVIALFDGTNGDPATAAEVDPTATPVSPNDNDSRATAKSITFGTGAVSFSGDTSMLPTDGQASALYNESSLAGGNVCSAGPTSKDAFYTFTLSAPAHVRMQVAGDTTAYAHTLALYNATPVALPATTATQYDTYALAAAAPAVTIDNSWVHYAADMSPALMSVEGLTTRYFAAGTDFQNDGAVQDLNAVGGTISGKQFRTKAASSYAGGADTSVAAATYPAPVCGGASAANDMIFKVRPTTNTRLRIGVDNPAPGGGFDPVIAVYDGAPLTTAEASSSPPVDINAAGNPNETFASVASASSPGALARVTAGKSTLFTGNEGAMASDYEASQLQAAGSMCTPAPKGAGAPDAFIQVNVRTIPDSVAQYTALWLDADDSTSMTIASGVSQWNDKSGNNRHVGQTTAGKRPAVVSASQGGRSGVDFDGTDDALVSSSFTALTGARTVFAVWKAKSGYAAGDPLLSTNGTATGFDLKMNVATTGQLQYAGVNLDPVTNNTGAALLELVQDGAGVATTYKSGTQTATATVAIPDYDIFRLGSDKAGTTVFTPMVLYELIVVTKAVSAAERQQVEGYLAHKWGLSGTLPGGHPYQGAAPTRSVEISSANTAFGHTLSLFDRVPMTRPAAAAGAVYNTADASLMAANAYGAVNGAWIERSATTVGLGVSELTAATKTAPADFTNPDADSHAGGVPDLGNPVGKALSTSGATMSGLASDYPVATVQCAADDADIDAIYKFTPGSNTRVSVRADASGWSPVVSIFDGTAGVPRDFSTTTASPIKLGFVPSNYDHTSYTYTKAVNLNCGGTPTFNSTPPLTAASFSGWCGATPDVTGPVAQKDASGPQVVILRMSSLDIANGTTLRLIGTYPVILAVDGNANIQGAIDAGANGATAGAGGNLSCSATTGTGGQGQADSGGGGGGGGGGFRRPGAAGAVGDDAAGGTAGAAGLPASASNPLVPLRGGCAGGRGSNGSAGGGGAGGAGGGAVQLAVNGTLTVAGTSVISARGGGGGAGSSSHSGGGGGGSGGAILIEAKTLSITSGSWFTANGGSGAGGIGLGSGSSDTPGSNGTTNSASVASGGQGYLLGGDGGKGSAYAKTGTGAPTNVDPTTPGADNDGAGGGGGGGGWVIARAIMAATNEDSATAQSVTIGALATYEGNTTSMASNVASASDFSTPANACYAAGTPDAFFKFTLGSSTPVRISTSGSSFDHTLSIWKDYGPDTRPRPTSAAPNPYTGASYASATAADQDTKALAQAGGTHLGDIDGTWKIRASTTAGMKVEGLTDATKTAPADFANADAIQDLGAITGTRTMTSGASTVGLGNDYSETTLQCGLGSVDSAPDSIFKFTGTAGHTVRVGVHNPAATGFTPAVAVFEGDPGVDPLTRNEDVTAVATNIAPPAAPSGGGCGALSVSNGHGYYYCATAATWQTARDRCESVGMTLAHVDDATEQGYVAGLTSADAWIGAYDALQTSASAGFRWIDGGDALSYANWNTSEPSSGSDDCVVLLASGDKWDAIGCTGSKAYVCEINLADKVALPQHFAVGSAQRLDGSTAGGDTRDVPSGLWDQARTFGSNVCSADASAPDASFEFTVRGSDAFPSGLVHRYDFTGARTVITDSVGASHGTLVNTQLNGDGNLYLQGGSTDEYVDLPNGIVSGLTNATFEMWLTWYGGSDWQRALEFGSTTPTAPAGCTNGGVEYYNGSYYFFCTNNKTWSAARDACGSGYLAQVDDAGEEAFLDGNAKFTAHSWIGANDLSGESGWFWSRSGDNNGGSQFCSGNGGSCAPVNGRYTHWDAGEPNDAGSNEDCALLVTTSKKWNDYGCSNSQAYICEIPGDGQLGARESYIVLSTNRGSNKPLLAYKKPGGTEVSVQPAGALTPGALLHMVAVFDDTGNSMKLYVNGTATSATWNDSLSSIRDVNNWLGRSLSSGDPLLGATIQEFRIYNRALSAAEVTAPAPIRSARCR